MHVHGVMQRRHAAERSHADFTIGTTKKHGAIDAERIDCTLMPSRCPCRPMCRSHACTVPLHFRKDEVGIEAPDMGVRDEVGSSAGESSASVETIPSEVSMDPVTTAWSSAKSSLSMPPGWAALGVAAGLRPFPQEVARQPQQNHEQAATL